MRTSTTSSTTRATGEQLVLMQGLYSLLEIGVWLFCSFQQVVTTHDSIVGLMQGGTMVPSNISAQELLIFLQSNMDKYNRVGWTVAVVCQVLFWGLGMPGSPIHNKLLHRIIIIVFFVLEVTTDLWYSIATNTTLGGAFVWVFSFGNGGWLVSLCYIAAMSAGSIFMGIRGFYRLEKVLAPVFRASKTA